MHFGQWIMQEYYVLTTSQKVSCILYIPLAQGSSNDVTYNCALSSSKKTADLALSLVLTAKHWAEEAEEEDGGLPPADSADDDGRCRYFSFIKPCLT